MHKSYAVHTLIAQISTQLHRVYATERQCTQHAWLLLSTVVKKSMAQLLTQQTITLTKADEEQLTQWITQLVQEDKPIQYIIGDVPFGDLTIAVSPPTLIPRPETEDWVHALIAQYKQKCSSDAQLRILDLCTGTGCIALTFAHAFKNATVIAVDIAADAVTLACRNAQLNSIPNVTVIQSDLFSALTPASFDLIIANPPYIPATQWSQLPVSVRAWEDCRALCAGDDGLTLIRAIIAQAGAWLTPNNTGLPSLALEIDCTQAAAAEQLMQEAGYCDITLAIDAAHLPRVIMGSQPRR
ncbi:MAG: peptide chain release factor N(5)-glutamine methyltransferase [Candidatus Babeliales bacterium]